MKYFKDSLLLILILGIVLGGYYFVQKNSKDKTDEKKSEIKGEQIISLTQDKIKEIEFNNKEEKIVLKNDGSKFNVSEPLIYRIKTGEISSIINTLISLESVKVIGTDIKELGQYGLETPSETINIMKQDGNTLISVGDPSPTKNGYYVKIDDVPTVYLVKTEHAEKIIVKLSNLRIDEMFAENDIDINLLELKKNAQTSFEVKKESDGLWKISKPSGFEIDETEFNNVLNAIKNIKAIEYIPYNMELLSGYGLDKPLYEIEMNTKDSRKTKLFIGNEKVINESRYARVEGEQEILVIDTKESEFLNVEAIDIIKKDVFTKSLDDLKEIKITDNEDEYNIRIEDGKPGDESDNKYFINEKEITDKNKFTNLYNVIKNIKFSGLKSEVPQKEMQLKISFKQKDDNLTSLLFIDGKDDKYYVTKNEEYTGGFVSKEDIDSLKNALKELIK